MKTSVLVLVATALNFCCFADSILPDPQVQVKEPSSVPHDVPGAIAVNSLPSHTFGVACDLTDDCVFQNTSLPTWRTLFLIPVQPVPKVTCSGIPSTLCGPGSVNQTTGVITLHARVPHNEFLELKFSDFPEGTTFILSDTRVVSPEPRTLTLVCGALLAFYLIRCRRVRHRAS